MCATAREKLVAGAHILAEIRLVMMIALAGFACLFTFPVWQMREMAVQSMTGVVILGIEVAILLPAVYLWVERWIGPEDLGHHFHPAESSFARLVRRLQAPAWLAWSAPPVVFAVGAALFVGGAIPTRTLPEEYIAGTKIAETFDLFARSGSGNEFLDVLVEPRRGTVRDPAFLAAAKAPLELPGGGEGSDDFADWQRERGLDPVRPLAVGSILGKLHQIARESYGAPMPATAEQAEDAFFLVEDELPREVRSQLWFDGGVRLLVSTQMNDSRELEALVERVLAYADARHGGLLSTTVFGKAPVYPEVDAYVTRGAAPNVFVSLAVIFAIYTAWIAWRARGLGIASRIRPWVGGWAMVSPFVFSAGVMAIVMATLGIPLSMSTASIGDLAINAAGDFSVFFVSAFLSAFAFRRELRRAIERTCTRESIVVAVDCLLNVVAFSPLMLSGFKPVRELGWMMAAMLISTLAGILCFLPAMLPSTVRPSNEDSLR
jgi:predicted RND superfamily exporter protein